MKVKDNQSIFDITIEQFGTLENLLTLIVDNSLSPGFKLSAGQELVINNTDTGNEEIKAFFKLGNIAVNNDQQKGLPPIDAGDYNNDFANDFE